MPSDAVAALNTELRASPFTADMTIDEFRASMPDAEAEPGTTVTPVDAAGVPGEWVVAAGADPNRRMLYVHGGGYVFMSAATHRNLTSRISQAAGIAVLSLDYRLAPEHPFPAAVEDSVAALAWMGHNGPAGASDASATFVAGDSAGGGLALATLLKTRDDGGRQADAAVTLSTFADMTLAGASMDTQKDNDVMVTRDVLDRMIRETLPNGELRDPLISPIFGDLAGLPPLYMLVGGAEVLLDDTTRFAGLARAAGVVVSVDVYPGLMHIFPLFAARLPEGQEAIGKIAAFLADKVPAS
jgi:monoterpene epsilon-lactone hydrolase